MRSPTTRKNDRPKILLLNWRDTTHPEGGGSERYVERMAEGLAARGYRVEIQCAAYPGAAPDEWRDGVLLRRRGNKFTVYAHALHRVRRAAPDLVIDVHNGMPFLSRLLAPCPVIVLVHHLHREQWRSAFGPILGGLGWRIESRLAPRLYRHCRYLTVSEITRSELAALGVERHRSLVIPNGTDPPPRVWSRRAADPTIAVVSRLVPHKRLEHAIDTIAELAPRWPTLTLDIVGHGPWDTHLKAHIARRGLTDRVRMHGWVTDQVKHEILARSWLHLCPSVKEGWGIVIMEAATHGVPTVAYRDAGGVAEAIVDGHTGALAEDFDSFVTHVETLLADPATRHLMGENGRRHASAYRWRDSLDAFEALVAETIGTPGSHPGPGRLGKQRDHSGHRPHPEIAAPRTHRDRGALPHRRNAERHP